MQASTYNSIISDHAFSLARSGEEYNSDFLLDELNHKEQQELINEYLNCLPEGDYLERLEAAICHLEDQIKERVGSLVFMSTMKAEHYEAFRKQLKNVSEQGINDDLREMFNHWKEDIYYNKALYREAA